MKKISLETDFKDYYDHLFYNPRESNTNGHFIRIADDINSFSKRNQFLHLQQLGFKVPRHGIVSNIIDLDKDIVVYVDELKHRGEGKYLIKSIQARKHFPNKYASEYIDYREGESYRLLQVGNRSFWYQYKSTTSWKSNCGHVEISEPIEVFDWWTKHTLVDSRPMFLNNYPIFAIDFVDSIDGKLAIDLNTAAGMRWTGMEEIMSPTNVYEEIADFMEAIS
jgi:hypothetical protein